MVSDGDRISGNSHGHQHSVANPAEILRHCVGVGCQVGQGRLLNSMEQDTVFVESSSYGPGPQGRPEGMPGWGFLLLVLMRLVALGLAILPLGWLRGVATGPFLSWLHRIFELRRTTELGNPGDSGAVVAQAQARDWPYTDPAKNVLCCQGQWCAGDRHSLAPVRGLLPVLVSGRNVPFQDDCQLSWTEADMCKEFERLFLEFCNCMVKTPCGAESGQWST